MSKRKHDNADEKKEELDAGLRALGLPLSASRLDIVRLALSLQPLRIPAHAIAVMPLTPMSAATTAATTAATAAASTVATTVATTIATTVAAPTTALVPCTLSAAPTAAVATHCASTIVAAPTTALVPCTPSTTPTTAMARVSTVPSTDIDALVAALKGHASELDLYDIAGLITEENVAPLLEALLKQLVDSKEWLQDDAYKFLVTFVQKNSKKVKRPALRDARSLAEEPYQGTLTEGFVEAIYNRDVPAAPITLQCINDPHDQTITKTWDDGVTVELRKISFLLSDGKYKVGAVLDSSLANQVGDLGNGNVVTIGRYFPMFHTPSPHQGAAADIVNLLVQDFSLLGKHGIVNTPQNFSAGPVPLPGGGPQVPHSPLMPGSVAMSPGTEAAPWRVSPHDCKGRHCSTYYKEFSTCVTLLLQPPPLEQLVRSCSFAKSSRPVNEMLNTHKRNVKYWWYATDVYLCTGKGNRMTMPCCIKTYVRDSHPESDPSNYSEERESEFEA